jgi:hypothetical protein
MLGNDKQVHTSEVVGTSLFDCAAKAMHDHWMCWWYDNEAPIMITLGEQSSTVKQSRVEWQRAKWKNPPGR